MDLIVLRERVSRWEDLHTEFKERIDNPDDLAASLVAFANTDGGQLVIGVARDRTVVGVVDADAEHRRVDAVAYNNCEPPLTVIQESIDLGDKKVVVVNVPKRYPAAVPDEPGSLLCPHYLRTTRCLARGAPAPVPGDRAPLL